jgi:effector-binding domain-containing protein/carbon monoxide dehydrogenase subunit G
MRWFAIVLAALLVVVGVLFGVGYLFLPSALKIERSIEVARPRAAVYAVLDNLRTFNEWSPWSAADPDAEYTFEGESGVGQSATWTTTSGGVGSGTQTIVRSVENQRVETEVDFGQRGKAKIAWVLEKAPAGTRVTWSMNADCRRSPMFDVACRYMNLLSKSAIETDYESGLTRLKALVEQLPAVDFEPLQPEFLNAQPMDYAFVENDVTRDPAPEGATPEAAAEADATYSRRVSTAISESLTVVAARLAETGSTLAGPPVMVTVSATDDRMVFRAGYPYSGGSPAGDPRVALGQTPSGRALKFVHAGPSQTMRQTYHMIGAYLAAHRIQAAGGPWEVHVQPTGDPATQRREIYIPIR